MQEQIFLKRSTSFLLPLFSPFFETLRLIIDFLLAVKSTHKKKRGKVIGYNFIHEERNCARNNKRKRRAVNYRKPKLRRGCGIREVLFSFLVTTITLYNKRTMDKKKKGVFVYREEKSSTCVFLLKALPKHFFFFLCVCAMYSSS